MDCELMPAGLDEQRSDPVDPMVARGLDGPRPAAAFRRGLTLCRRLEASIELVESRRSRTGVQSTRSVVPAQRVARARVYQSADAVIALLPKPLYLLRVIEVPKVEEGESQGMIELEVEATLPPGFGPAKVASRKLEDRRDGYSRHEVYVARQVDLEHLLGELASAGIECDAIIPSALAWHLLQARLPDADMLVGSVDSVIEAASHGTDGSIGIRILPDAGSPEAIKRALAEYVRPLLSQRRADDSPVNVAWLASPARPMLDSNRARTCPVALAAADPLTAPDDQLLLPLLAETILHTEPQIVDRANLLPSTFTSVRARRQSRRRLLAIAACLMGAVLLSYAALRVSAARCRTRVEALSAQTASIRHQGELVGKRIDQLRAIRLARSSRDDFTRIVAALHGAKEPGVTYSAVELYESGMVRLQGQAPVLSQPMLLPEKLERQGAFTEVHLRDAAQSRRGEGVVAEFRIECKLRREGPP